MIVGQIGHVHSFYVFTKPCVFEIINLVVKRPWNNLSHAFWGDVFTFTTLLVV